MPEKYFSEAGEWTCPRCGERSTGPRCGRCRFCIYAGFWTRVLASLVDKAFIWSIAKFFLLIRNVSLTGYCLLSITGFLIYRFYHIGLVALWGQTPGKMAARIKIVRSDGSPVRWWNALLRNSVESLLTGFVLYLEIRAATLVPPAAYAAADALKRDNLIDSFIPGYESYIILAVYAFVLSEFIVLLLNKKKRAIHDFIAGTVIVHDTRLPYFPWEPTKKAQTGP